MKCEQVQPLLVAYLDGEVSPSERILIRVHLSDCTVCQQELDLLFTAQDRVRSVLQHRTVDAVPARDAWVRLEKRLTKADRPSSKSKAWLSRLAPNAGRASIRKIFGGVTMRNRLIASALGSLAVITIVVVLMARSVTPVSAKEILDRASQVQSMKIPTEGIGHIRTETYSNFQALPEGQGTDTVVESYLDFQSGDFRNVTTDNKTGKVLDVFAYDGTYSYSPDYNQESGQGGVINAPLTIYRTPQANASVSDMKLRGDNEAGSKDVFDLMRQDPDVRLVGQETWVDGRKVYVLQSQHIKVPVFDPAGKPTGLVNVYPDVNNQAPPPITVMKMYFDVNTYQTVGSQETLEQDGKQVLIRSQRQLVNEIMPVASKVDWSLGDVQGITIVDDPTRTHGDLLPEVVTPQALPTQNQSIYLLKDVPAGYSLEITAPPKQSANDPYIYVASYRTPSNDYFVIQAATPVDVQGLMGQADEIYTTVSGLKLYFTKDLTSSGKLYTSAIVETPDGIAFWINSTLPRETVRAWAENLVPAK